MIEEILAARCFVNAPTRRVIDPAGGGVRIALIPLLFTASVRGRSGNLSKKVQIVWKILHVARTDRGRGSVRRSQLNWSWE